MGFVIERLELKNWMPYRGVFELSLPTGPIAIVARYVDDDTRSNRGGKTALLQAIRWCLFEAHGERYDDDVIHRGTDSTYVGMRLSDGATLATIDRSRKRGQSTRIKVVVDGVAHEGLAAGVAIRSLIGLSREDYSATVDFEQGDTESIVTRENATRRKTISTWLDLDAWVRVAARARAAAKTVTQSLRDAAQSLDAAKIERATIAVDALEQTMAEKSKSYDLARRRLDVVNKTLERAAEAEIRRLDAERLVVVREEIATLRAAMAGKGVAAADLEAARSKAVMLGAELRRAEDGVADAKRLAAGEFDGRCPVRAWDCPVADQIRDDRASAKTRLKVLRDGAGEVEQTARVARAALIELETANKAHDADVRRYNELVAEAKRLKTSTESDAGEDVDVDGLREQQAALREEERVSFAELREAKTKIARAAELDARIEEVAERLAAQESEARIATAAVRACGSAGIPALIAESSLLKLEERANALLSGCGVSISFAWDRATKSLASSCDDCGYAYKGQRDKRCPACGVERVAARSDDLEILVDDGTGVVRDARRDSGGGKILVGSSIRLAAAMMLRERRGARCAWGLIDEPFGPLDVANRERLAAVFAGMLGSVGLEQAFVVSHDASILDALPTRIQVVRDGDVSRVEVLT